jgi:hypothetical protein
MLHQFDSSPVEDFLLVSEDHQAKAEAFDQNIIHVIENSLQSSGRCDVCARI